MSPIVMPFEWMVEQQIARWLSARSSASVQRDERALNLWRELLEGRKK